jgi:hypothetical protein
MLRATLQAFMLHRIANLSSVLPLAPSSPRTQTMIIIAPMIIIGGIRPKTRIAPPPPQAQ